MVKGEYKTVSKWFIESDIQVKLKTEGGKDLLKRYCVSMANTKGGKLYTAWTPSGISLCVSPTSADCKKACDDHFKANYKSKPEQASLIYECNR